MISTAKSIPYNGIGNKIPASNRARLKPRFGLAERNSAQVCCFRCVIAGILFFYGRRPYKLQAWNQPFRVPVAIGTAQKETDLIPKSNRMPDRSQRVKDATPNLHP
jgi:hypothetical protein